LTKVNRIAGNGQNEQMNDVFPARVDAGTFVRSAGEAKKELTDQQLSTRRA
jgi:hypothetical protein